LKFVIHDAVNLELRVV